MDERLDKIINLLLLNQANATTGPSPYHKKLKPTSYDDEQDNDMEVDHFTTLKHQVTTETIEIVEWTEFESSKHTIHCDQDSPPDDSIILQDAPQPTDQGTLSIPDSPDHPDSDWLHRPNDSPEVIDTPTTPYP